MISYRPLARFLLVAIALLAAGMLRAQSPTVQLDRMIDSRGTLRLPDGFSGTIDARGWRLDTDRDGAPRFTRADRDVSPLSSSVPEDVSWDSAFGAGGVDGWMVTAILVDGSNVYVGGNFTRAGSIGANHIARWDGSAWHALGSGLDSPPSALAKIGSDIYAGGGFEIAGGDTVNGVAKWNGTTWSRLGGAGDFSGVISEETFDTTVYRFPGNVNALAAVGDELYVGGSFTHAGGAPAQNIAMWNATTNAWSALGSGTNRTVNALAASGNTVYAGGRFDTIGGLHAIGIAAWNRVAKSWSPLGSGLRRAGSRDVYAIVPFGGSLYVGGRFDTAGAVRAYNIARWDSAASTWSALGDPLLGSGGGIVGRIALLGPNDLYALVERQSDERIVFQRWNGSSWSEVPDSGDDFVVALATSGPDLYAGGAFSTIGGIQARGIARRTGAAWLPLGQGVSGGGGGIVYAVVAVGDEIYFAGNFDRIGGLHVANIAAWNTTTKKWSALGTGEANGVDGPVYTMAVRGNEVYVAGNFGGAGSIQARNIASWDRTSRTWSALGTAPDDGVSGNIRTLAVDGSNLYVGGDLSRAGTIDVKGVTVWNAEEGTWSSVGESYFQFFISVQINAIVAQGGNIIMGGSFSATTGQSGTGVAIWNGTELSILSSSIDGSVDAMALTEQGLVIAGSFSYVENIDANNIALFDGVEWKSLGAGTDGSIYALAVNGNRIYAGGSFTRAGGTDAANVAMWDGSWHPLGSGTDGRVMGMTTSPTGLYVGGFFAAAGEKPAYRVGRWSEIERAVMVTVAPTTIDFGDVAIGGNVLRTFTITNNSGSTESVTGDVQGVTGVFEIVSGAGAFTLAPGQSKTITVRFSPTAGGEYTAFTVVTHNGTTASPVDVTFLGNASPTVSVRDDASVSGSLAIRPNPTAGMTSIDFTLGTMSDVRIVLSDVLGQEVATLLDAKLPAGEQSLHFDATTLARGVYLLRLQAGTRVETRRVEIK